MVPGSVFKPMIFTSVRVEIRTRDLANTSQNFLGRLYICGNTESSVTSLTVSFELKKREIPMSIRGLLKISVWGWLMVLGKEN
jgi:hypothetical protein